MLGPQSCLGAHGAHGGAPGSGFLDGKPEKEWGFTDFTSENVDLSYEKSLKEWISPVKMWIEATN